jgi:hypothetical protein
MRADFSYLVLLTVLIASTVAAGLNGCSTLQNDISSAEIAAESACKQVQAAVTAFQPLTALANGGAAATVSSVLSYIGTGCQDAHTIAEMVQKDPAGTPQWLADQAGTIATVTRQVQAAVLK